MNTILTIFVALLIFGLLILAHEYGHFIAARKNGVTVLEFAMGMGPVLWQKESKGTKYSLRLFPIGGFCAMLGEDEEEAEIQPGSINSISPARRIIVMAAGALMNFAVAIIIFFCIFAIAGTDTTTTIGTILPDYPAWSAGIRDGDKILAIGETEIVEWEQVAQVLNQTDGEEVPVTVERSGTRMTFMVTPHRENASSSWKMGVLSKTEFRFFHAIGNSFAAIGQYIVLVFQLFGKLFTGQYAAGEVFSGPIGITAEIGRQMADGLLPVLNISAAIAVSLGFFNLFPLPALDGSRIVFALIELIKGKPIPRKWEARIHFTGFVVLIFFAIFIAFNDITKLL